MKMGVYLKEKSVYLCVNLLIYLIISFFLYNFNVSLYVISFLFLCWFVPLIGLIIMDFSMKKDFYSSIEEGVNKLDQKYFLQTLIEEPEFLEGKIVYDILAKTNRQMHEEVKKYQTEQLEYRDYIEAWVHEIKTPIAASKLILDNQGDTKAIYEELKKIEDYIEQTLYYARSSQASKDYLVKEFALRPIVSNVIKKHARSFIHKKIKLELETFDEVVFSDVKWVEFIINQLIVNSINYSKKENGYLHIYIKKQENNLILTIEDNGIGIDEKDLPRVFQKGFTGENGRVVKKSTGMGLYLSKKLAEKLYMGLEIESTKNVGTKVHLIFPLSKLTLLEK